MSSDDTFRGTNYTIRHTSAGQYFISHPQGSETFDSFEELVDSHPITEESREYFFGTIDEDNFHEYFTLDYAMTLAAGCDDIDVDSVLVTKLADGCRDRGYHVSREVCRSILMSFITHTRTTIKVTTTAGTSSTALGDAYSAYDGVSWRNSVDNADSDGCGRVFLDCESAEVAEYVSERLEADDRVDSYELV